jgi:hypothetical protein
MPTVKPVQQQKDKNQNDPDLGRLVLNSSMNWNEVSIHTTLNS